MSLRVAQLADGRRAIIIRTSDRINFKQCRRKWAWSSHLKRNLGPRHLVTPLWFGTGIHFALEDFHGHNKFGAPARAFLAYCIATSRQDTRMLPPDAQEMMGLGQKMMDYYTKYWLRFRRDLPTYVIDGEPQCEVNFEIPIPFDENPQLEKLALANGADCILYRGTMDKIAYDPDEDGLWVDEYKTAARYEQFHFQTDPQVTTYVWAASHIYNKPILGVRYLQFIKNAPEPPRILASGKLSTASNLVSSYPLYYEALERFFGDADRAGPEYHQKLAELGRAEDEHGDRFIRRDIVRRNIHACNAEAMKILLEAEDMLNPDLPLYPNPTRMCPRMCSFLAPCVTMDDGGDWEYELEQEFDSRDQDAERYWRRRLPPVESLLRLVDSGQVPDLEGAQAAVMNADQEMRAAIMAGETMGEIPTFRM